MWALKIWLLFKLLAFITFYSNMVQPQNFQSLLTIYLALQNFLQNPNTTFQYWDLSHQMTWYILSHMPYVRRPGHICCLITLNETITCGKSQLCTHNKSSDMDILKYDCYCIMCSIALMHVKMKIWKTVFKLFYSFDYLLFNYTKWDIHLRKISIMYT